jgi:hypothetical protein
LSTLRHFGALRLGKAVHQTVEQGLGLPVNPVEVLEDQEQGLLSGFPQEQLPDGVEGTLAPLPRVERLLSRVVHRYVEQGQQRRQNWLQAFVQGEQLARHLLADLAGVIPLLDLEVAFEKVDHRQVARRLAVGDRGAFEGEPTLKVIPLNSPHRPSNQQRSSGDRAGPGNERKVGTGSRFSNPGAQGFKPSCSSQQAAEAAAMRRWNGDLLDRFRSTPVYAVIVDALDQELQNAATEAELKRRGAGVDRILRELAVRNVLP